LLVCRSTVAVDELVPAADVPDDADDADDADVPDDGDDGEDADDAEPEPPELQAASTTPAAASGSPNLIASGIFPDDNSGLFMGCAYAFLSGGVSSECLAPLNTPPPQRQFDRYAMSHITG
jgi:hypothetical protein